MMKSDCVLRLDIPKLKHILLSPQQLGPNGQPCVWPANTPAAQLCQTAWTIPWDRFAPRDVINFVTSLPAWIGLHTSGHTGTPELWYRTREQLLAEVRLLREICNLHEVDGVITFAPLPHLYGFLFSFLLPAVQRIPVLFLPMSAPGPIDSFGLKRPLFVTIPSALTILERQRATLATFKQTTIIHSTAVLPPAASRLLQQKQRPPLSFIEILGATETGLIATRSLSTVHKPPWKLATDTTFAWPAAGDQATLLAIHSPRIAYNAHGHRPLSWQTDDYVQMMGSRHFRLIGRRSRLVKVNGRRISLDQVEAALRQAIPCQDLACLPTRDDYRGEVFDLLLVADANRPIQPEAIRHKCREILTQAEQPYRIHLVPQLERSSMGKLISMISE